ncbi:hypothetical protein PFNF54_04282 [Plasmodium falciparum NF54]|uniref:Uncharacterized protein n=1 Tax=Plasmodium falciparum (isolate NF54) TaxID=5843 RepID=W7JQ42_PLAFO|nr:hypothetical protein PFNF54_04282 [Plasmodium falciparum NF54]
MMDNISKKILTYKSIVIICNNHNNTKKMFIHHTVHINNIYNHYYENITSQILINIYTFF